MVPVANGIYQNSIFGMAAKLPGKYTGVVVLGNNISGTFTAIVSILSSLMTSNTKMAAIYYFVTALFVLLICFVTYFSLQRNVSLKILRMLSGSGSTSIFHNEELYYIHFFRGFTDILNRRRRMTLNRDSYCGDRMKGLPTCTF